MTDNCPRCFTSTEPQTPADGPQRYACRACGHSWTTNRNEAAWAPPADDYATYDDPDAWEAEDPYTEPYDPRWDDWPQQDTTPDPTEADLIARILARENQTTHTVERIDPLELQ
ncbi:hypothetical protein OH738_18150 [Streptomyces hirsutus]|uniref:hypothetical protein n=1 Tax=Streptomyces hirsutus TaxID=35620 RepID=UPI003863587A|nr:hypothetical protein OH738_18150 [Streptomyces hirsutus]